MRAICKASNRRAAIRSALRLALPALAVVLPATASAASPGTLNSAFGPGGSKTIPSVTRFFATAAQSNGAIVAAGEDGTGTATQLLVARFTRTGSLDGSFGSGGIVHGPAIAGATGSRARAVAIQSDGKIVVVGTATDKTGSARNGLLIERFNTNGSLDTSFGTGGVVDQLTTTFGDGFGVAIQANGAILASGAVAPSAVPFPVVIRVTSAGKLDPTFGSGGIDQLNFGNYSHAFAVAAASNGSIAVAGDQSPGLQAVNAVVARLTPNGALDTGFAGAGATNFVDPYGGANATFNSVAFQSNGAIVVGGGAAGGTQNANAVVIRYTTSGAKDPSFGSGGVAAAASATGWTIGPDGVVPGANAIAIAKNGDVVAAGRSATGVINSGAVWAFKSNGQPDTTFGSHGSAVFTNSAGLNTTFAGLAISPADGNLYAAGDGNTFGSGFVGLVASYIGFGPPTPPPPPAMKLTVTGVKANYQAATVTFSAACNQACSLKATLAASAATAKQLKIGTTKTVCRKVNGKRKCKKVTTYKPFTAATASATLRAAGTKAFTLRLSPKVASALHKQKSATFSLLVTGTSLQTRKTATFRTNVTFKK